jgi:DNA-binding FadR family transcriptional regulator
MDGEPKPERRRLVQGAADRLRAMILACAPGVQIGGLADLAQQLGVGVVTVQQAARVLEHEGLLEVRRGPGGGYYGRRPTEAALERSVTAYLRIDGARYHEIFEIMSLLECELAPAAARSPDEDLREQLREALAQLDESDAVERQVAVEEVVYSVLFRMVDQPLISLLGRVTVQAYRANPHASMLLDAEGVAAWRAGRRRVLEAILTSDEDLARFEAGRYREDMLGRLRSAQGA